MKPRLKKLILSLFSICLLGLSNLIVKIVPFRKLLKYLTNQDGYQYNSINQATARRVFKIDRTIQLVSQKTPWRSMCFEQAITAIILFRVLGISYSIYFGMRKDEDGKLEAHAWTRVGDYYATGKNTMTSFTPIIIRSYEKRETRMGEVNN